jgi:hypothetical protein
MKIIERIVDLETGETTEVERTLTKAEVDAIEARKAEKAAKAEITATKAAEKVAVLAKLGLTADEVAALLS